LRDYGLSEKEAKVYLACLKSGASTANKISNLTELRRSTTYDILQALKSKGLIGFFVKDKKYYFQAVEPRELIALLKEKEDKIKRVLPELEKIKESAREKPLVEMFEGIKGAIALLEELYKEKELLVYGSAQKAYESLKHIPESLARRRVEEKIKAKMIFEKSKYALFRIEDPKIRKVTEMKFLKSMEKCPTVTFIAGCKVGILSFDGEISGVYIQDKEISDTQRIVFENLWNRANK